MGMSHDYKTAVLDSTLIGKGAQLIRLFQIEEGSTSVRVGSSIFGERVYNKH